MEHHRTFTESTDASLNQGEKGSSGVLLYVTACLLTASDILYPLKPKTPSEPTFSPHEKQVHSDPSIRKETGLNSKNLQQNPKITKRGPMLTTHPLGRDPRQSLPIPDS